MLSEEQQKAFIFAENLVTMAEQFRVSSEVGTLRRFITHHPDEGIARVHPKRSDELFFDNILHLTTMQKEHDVFVDVVHAFMEKGRTILPAPEISKQGAHGLEVNTVEQTIITLPSRELSLARGGSRCMYCPINRASV